MIRAYFDWNVFSNLKRESESPFKSILLILNTNKEKLFLPYSPAHLSDLKRGFSDSERSKSKTYFDLELLSKISMDHCLYFDMAFSKVTPRIFNTSEYFNQLIEDVSLIKLNLDALFTNSLDEDISNQWKEQMEILKQTPTGIDLSQWDLFFHQSNAGNEFSPNFRREDSLYNLLKDAIETLTSHENHSYIYKSFRNASTLGMKIKTDSSQWGNAFDYLDETLKKSHLDKSFRQIIDEALNIRSQDKPTTRFDYFVNHYISLDTFGFYKDAEFPNLIDDAIHAFYGAHCDIFVTDDVRTYQKTKAVYEDLKIGTIVSKSADFPSIYYSLDFLKEIPGLTIAERVVDAVNNSLILQETIDNEFNPVTIYDVKYPIAAYFNRLQYSRYEDCAVLLAYKKQDNYSDFMFPLEIKSVVDKIVSDFGLDDNLRSDYVEEKEQVEISEGFWPGRVWKHKSSVTQVLYLQDSVGLSLRITLP